MVKRSDVDELELLEACDAFHHSKLIWANGVWTYLPRPPDESLSHKWPAKVIMAKMEQLDKKGYLEVGVSLRTAWLTDEGIQRMQELRERRKA